MSLQSDSGYEGSTLFGKMGRQSQNKGHNLRPYLHSGEQYIHTPGPHDYRDYAASTVSALESMPDQSFQPNMDLTPEHAIDPNLDNQALLGVGVEHIGTFAQISLANGSIITPPIDFSAIQQTDQPFNFSQDNEPPSPWNINNMKRPHPSQSYGQQGNGKRVRLHVDSGYPSQEPTPSSQFSSSAGARSPHQMNLQYSQQHQMQYQYPHPHIEQFNAQGNPNFVHQQPLEMLNQSTARGSSTSAPATTQTSPNRKQSKSKSPRKQDKKHTCPQCGNDKTFSTSNDLDRHLKTVHGIIAPGEKVWLCKLPGCGVSTKVWARLDNFKQHVIRMHGPEYADQADEMSAEYDLDVHGPVDVGKSKSRNTQNIHQRPTLQDMSTITHTGFNLGSVTSQPRHSSSAHLRRPSHLPDQEFGPLDSSGNTPRSGNTSMINQGQRSYSTVSMTGAGQSQYVAPQLLQTVSSHRMQPQRQGPCTIADPEMISQQRQFFQEQDQTLPTLPLLGPSNADLGFMGKQHDDGSSKFNEGLEQLVAERESAQDTDRIELEATTPRISSQLSATISAFHESLPSQHRERFKQIYQILSHLPPETSQQRSDKAPKTSSETKTNGAKAKIHSCSKKVIIDGIEKDCKKSFDKKSELKKHESRHLRKYGCTFDNCYKRFGTKWEWKRHEHNQHVQLEGWRCLKKGCEQHFDDEKGFVNHLKAQHKVRDQQAIDEELKASHLEKMWLGTYWCGFCEKVMRCHAPYGSAMDEERNAHVSKHIDSGIDGKKSDMLDWIELKAIGRTKRQMRELHRDVKSLQPTSKDKVAPEINDESSSDDENDAPGEDDNSPPASKATPGASNAQSRQMPNTANERRRASAPNPTIVVSPAEEEQLMSAFHSHASQQHHQTSPEEGHDMYTLNEVSSGYECNGCMNPFCPSCDLKDLSGQPQRHDASSLHQSGYSEAADDMDMF